MRAGALGDLLLLRPALSSLRAAGHAVELLAPLPAAEALVGPGPADAAACRRWDDPALGSLLSEHDELPEPLRDWLSGFDAALVYSRSPALARRLGAAIARVVVQDPDPNGEHAARWLCRPLAALGVTEVSPPPLAPAETERARPWLEQLPERFLAIHPGSGSPRKNWPVERFAALAGELAGGAPWLLVHGPADAAAAGALRGLPGAVEAPGLPVRVLATIVGRAGLHVGNDSGASHLAAATGAPTLALFGPTDPALWAPLGPRVVALRDPSGQVQALGVEGVARAARALWAA